MIIVAFYLISIIAMRVIQSIYSKKANLLLPSGINPYVRYIFVSNALATLFALLAVFIGPFGFSGFDFLTVLIATVSGVFLAFSSLFGILALKSGTMVLSSIFATAGLIVPSFLGVIFFNESISLLQLIFLGVLIFSMCILAVASKDIYGQFNLKNIFYLIGTLISNGMVMFCQKLFGQIRPDGNVSLFSMLTFAIPSIMLASIMLFINKEKVKVKEQNLPKIIYLCALFLAFAVFVIQQFVTILTTKMSTILLFSFVNCGATIISAIVGAIMYKEKLTFKSSFAVIIGVGALIGLKLFE